MEFQQSQNFNKEDLVGDRLRPGALSARSVLRSCSAFLHADAEQRTALLLARGQPLLPLQNSQPGQPAGMPRRSVKEKLRTISNFSLARLVEFDDL